MSKRKAVGLQRAGDYFVALCDDGTLWELDVLSTDHSSNTEWRRCSMPIPGCAEVKT